MNIRPANLSFKGPLGGTRFTGNNVPTEQQPNAKTAFTPSVQPNEQLLQGKTDRQHQWKA